MKRTAGILLHITSLPGKYGIGTLGKEAYKFVDKLKAASQRYWQILPLNPVIFGNSPYQSTCVFAGNYYLIDYDLLVKDRLLSKKDLPEYNVEKIGSVDYEFQEKTKLPTLKKAFKNFNVHNEEYISFKEKEAFWLNDYALFTAIKAYYKDKPFWEWDKDIAQYRQAALIKYAKMLSDETEFYKFIKYIFFKQWKNLKEYANSVGILIIGDIPFYCAKDSAEYWANYELFNSDKRIAGCPPDVFASEGQLWGNPVYDFDKMQKSGYRWWIRRFMQAFEMYNYVRVDHFRGFEAYYSVDKNANNAVNGYWTKGPGKHIFDVVSNIYGGKLPIIAEDLGLLTSEVFELLAACGYPGTKVLQFAFDSSKSSIYLPHRYERNCVVYTGTHDNNTSNGWFDSLSREDKKFVNEYTGKTKEQSMSEVFMRIAYSSVADLAIIPMQDVLGLDENARMNIPGTVGKNWRWRLRPNEFSAKHIKRLKLFAENFGRM